MYANGVGVGRRGMSSFKKFLLFVIIVLLGILELEIQPVQALPAAGLTPGHLIGSFYLSLKKVISNDLSNGAGAIVQDSVYDLDMEGEILIESRIIERLDGSKSPSIKLDLVTNYARAYYLLTYTLKGGGQSCHALGLLNVETKVGLSRDAIINLNGKGSQFKVFPDWMDFTDPMYYKQSTGSIPNCDGPVAQEILREDLARSAKLISQLVFVVTDYTDQKLMGKITLADWPSRTDLKYGWEDQHLEKGVWSAYRSQDKPAGWKK